MLKKRIIPCLDIKNGRVVKGVNFENLADAGDPLKQALFYYLAGADEICLLDITATVENRQATIKILQDIAKQCFVPITIGGGVKDLDSFSLLIASGADKVSINSSAINNPKLINDTAKKFGSQAVVLAVDVKKIDNEYFVFTHSGSKNSGLKCFEWLKMAVDLGAGEILLTSMDKDGTKSGYDCNLIKKVTDLVSVPVIASGGVGNLEHLAEGFRAGADAVLAASIFHFQEFTISQAKQYLTNQGFAIRNN